MYFQMEYVYICFRRNHHEEKSIKMKTLASAGRRICLRDICGASRCIRNKVTENNRKV